MQPCQSDLSLPLSVGYISSLLGFNQKRFFIASKMPAYVNTWAYQSVIKDQLLKVDITWELVYLGTNISLAMHASTIGVLYPKAPLLPHHIHCTSLLIL